MIKTLVKWLHTLSWRFGWVNRKFPGTSTYWQNLYQKGGDSGPGSYNRLANFKAKFINEFITVNEIRQVVELGCGDGNQLSLLEIENYTGFDISPAAVELCNAKFATDASKKFFVYDENFESIIAEIKKAELTLSLDVIFHLVEDTVFEEYMKNLFFSSKKYIIIYSSDYNSRQTFHEKHRKFSDWIRDHARDWKQIHFEANLYPFNKKEPEHSSESNFYVYTLK